MIQQDENELILQQEMQRKRNEVNQAELVLQNAVGERERIKERVRFLENELTARQAELKQTQVIFNTIYPNERPPLLPQPIQQEEEPTEEPTDDESTKKSEI